ncbi:hypothetical protein HII31_12884, partial [Pseudocercospora fuligena]
MVSKDLQRCWGESLGGLCLRLAAALKNKAARQRDGCNNRKKTAENNYCTWPLPRVHHNSNATHMYMQVEGYRRSTACKLRGQEGRISRLLQRMSD